jgi:hypothetical protein
VQHLVRRRRRRLAPELLHKPIAGNQLVRPQEQQRQQSALAPGANRDLGTAIANDLEWAKQAKIQTFTTVRNEPAHVHRPRRLPRRARKARRDHLLWARQLQTLSLGVQIPPICFGIAFPAIALFVERLGCWTGDRTYRALAKRWSKVMLMLFAVWVVTSTILSFEWQPAALRRSQRPGRRQVRTVRVRGERHRDLRRTHDLRQRWHRTLNRARAAPNCGAGPARQRDLIGLSRLTSGFGLSRTRRHALSGAGAAPEHLRTAASAAKANTSIIEHETTALDDLRERRRLACRRLLRPGEAGARWLSRSSRRLPPIRAAARH